MYGTWLRQVDAEALRKVVPPETRRLLIKSRNTVRRLMHHAPFVTDYTALTACASAFLVHETEVELVGVDYLSVAPYADLTTTHVNLLGSLGRDITVLEGLVLEHVDAGEYELLCLPIKLVGADGAPCRAVLRQY